MAKTRRQMAQKNSNGGKASGKSTGSQERNMKDNVEGNRLSAVPKFAQMAVDEMEDEGVEFLVTTEEMTKELIHGSRYKGKQPKGHENGEGQEIQKKQGRNKAKPNSQESKEASSNEASIGETEEEQNSGLEKPPDVVRYDNNTRNTTSSLPQTLKISIEDIMEEVEYWKLAIVCYVMGAAPHPKAFEGFAKRIWGQNNVDKAIPIKRGIFVIRFLNKETMNQALSASHLMFDKNPVFIKQWEEDMDFSKIDIKAVPTWIQLPYLPVRYWGRACLEKIVSLVGKPIKPDLATQTRERIAYARYLVEVQVSEDLPDCIAFENEKGVKVEFPIIYEWRPSLCTTCKKLGHFSKNCRASQKQIWRPKEGQTGDNQEQLQIMKQGQNQERSQITQKKDGWQESATKKKNYQNKKDGTQQVHLTNQFQLLSRMNECLYVGDIDLTQCEPDVSLMGNG